MLHRYIIYMVHVILLNNLHSTYCMLRILHVALLHKLHVIFMLKYTVLGYSQIYATYLSKS